VDLSVVIPTRDRRPVLRETLERLERQAGDVSVEIKVVDDGSSDGTPDAVRAIQEKGGLDLELIEQPGHGPAIARNRALAAVSAPACLFLNDDSVPRPGLLARHRDFHARHPEPAAALLGATVLPEQPPATPFMRWLADNHFDYAGIEDPRSAGGGRFFTSNVSAKTAFVLEAGGFDESFREAANEDVELGLRLAARGMRLEYDPDAIVEHQHPSGLAEAIHRYMRTGRMLVPLVERHPDWPVPRRPGARHRAKAAALGALTRAGVRPLGVRREVWRFICHEAAREGYWSAVEGGRGDDGLRIGAGLARRAVRDPDAQLPA
jgi:GT2 family glycosyltransferase